MALFLQLQVHSHPERYATLVWGPQWPMCTLEMYISKGTREQGSEQPK